MMGVLNSIAHSGYRPKALHVPGSPMAASPHARPDEERFRSKARLQIRSLGLRALVSFHHRLWIRHPCLASLGLLPLFVVGEAVVGRGQGARLSQSVTKGAAGPKAAVAALSPLLG